MSGTSLGGKRVASIDDVARRAKVSAATVSRVLNGTTTVAPEKVAVVRKAVADLRYVPFGPARALRQQRVREWAAIVADIENPFFTSVVRGIEDVAHGHGYRLVLCNSDEDLSKEAGYVDTVLRERMAGVVIAVASASETRIGRLSAEGIPVVAIDRKVGGHQVGSVIVDNGLGARAATRHLIECGWRRVGCIVGPTRISTSNERLEGYRQGLQEMGRPFERTLVRRADIREDGGHRAALSLLRSAKPPDALFVGNNLMTLGALRAIQEVGRDVPDDIGVVGFDDSPAAALTRPRLSVVAQPTYEIGRQAAEKLLEAMQGAPPQDVVLEPELIVRESSRRRAGGAPLAPRRPRPAAEPAGGSAEPQARAR